MHVGQTNNELNGMSYTSIAVLATWIRNQLLTTAIHLSVSRIVVEVYHAMSNPLNEPPTRQLWHYYQTRTGCVRRHRMVINQEGEAPSKGSRLGLQCDPSTSANPTPSRPPRPCTCCCCCSNPRIQVLLGFLCQKQCFVQFGTLKWQLRE